MNKTLLSVSSLLLVLLLCGCGEQTSSSADPDTQTTQAPVAKSATGNGSEEVTSGDNTAPGSVLKAALQGDVDLLKRLIGNGGTMSDAEFKSYLDGGLSSYLADPACVYPSRSELHTLLNYEGEVNISTEDVPGRLYAAAGISNQEKIPLTPPNIKHVLPLLVKLRGGVKTTHADGSSYLVSAAYGPADMLTTLLELGSDPNVVMEDGTALLLWSMQQRLYTLRIGNHMSEPMIIGIDADALVLPLINAGADCSVTTTEGQNALQLALTLHDKRYLPLASIHALIKKGLSPTATLGDDPVKKALKNYSPALAATLVAAGLSPASLSTHDCTRLLGVACLMNLNDAIDPLIAQANDADILIRSGNKYFGAIEPLPRDVFKELLLVNQPLDLCVLAIIGNNDTALKMLLETIPDTLQQEHKHAWLCVAAHFNAPFFRRIVDKTETNLAKLPWEVLQSIVDGGDPALLSDSLQTGLDPDTAGPDGQRLLHYAAFRARPEMLDVLLKAGADVGATGGTLEYAGSKPGPLHWLVEGTRRTALQDYMGVRDEGADLRHVPAACKLLLAAGADLNAMTSKGVSPTAMALRCHDYACKNLGLQLIEHGATLPIEDPYLCYHVLCDEIKSKREKSAAVVHALLKAGAPAQMKPKKYNSSALVLASQYAPASVVSALLDAGADVNAVDGRGETPLYATIFKHREDVFTLLLDRGALIDVIVPGHDVSVRQCIHVIEDHPFKNRINEELQRRPLKQPLFFGGIQSFETTSQTAPWGVPGWRFIAADGATGWIARDGRTCSGWEEVPSLNGFRMRINGIWQFVRNTEIVYDELEQDPGTELWIARTASKWAVLAPNGTELISGLQNVLPGTSLLQLFVIQRNDLWGAVDVHGQSIIDAQLSSAVEVYKSLCQVAKADFESASDPAMAVVAAARWLACEIACNQGENSESVCQPIINALSGRYDNGLIAMVLDLAIGIDDKKNIAPCLTVLGWKSLSGKSAERISARRQLDLVSNENSESTISTYDTWASLLPKAPFGNEDAAARTALKSSKILELRHHLGLRFTFSFMMKTKDNETFALIQKVLDPDDLRIVRAMARDLVKAYNENTRIHNEEQEKEKRAQAMRRMRDDNRLKHYYPKLKEHIADQTRAGPLLTLSLPADQPMRAVMPIADTNGAVVFMDESGTKHSQQAYETYLLNHIYKMANRLDFGNDLKNVPQAFQFLIELKSPQSTLLQDFNRLLSLMQTVQYTIGHSGNFYWYAKGNNDKQQNRTKWIKEYSDNRLSQAKRFKELGPAVQSKLKNEIAKILSEYTSASSNAGELLMAYINVLQKGPEVKTAMHMSLAADPPTSLDPQFIAKVISHAQFRLKTFDQQLAEANAIILRHQAIQAEAARRQEKERAEREERWRQAAIQSAARAEAWSSFNNSQRNNTSNWEASLDRSLGSENNAAWNHYVRHNSNTWQFRR